MLPRARWPCGPRDQVAHRLTHDMQVRLVAGQDLQDLWAMTDLAVLWCVCAVLSTGVRERLLAGPQDVSFLAAECGLDAEALQAVHGQVAERGLFARIGPGRFALYAAALLLLARRVGSRSVQSAALQGHFRRGVRSSCRRFHSEVRDDA